VRKRVLLRVHGPWHHRNQWRIEIFVKGKRTRRSYSSYSEALLAAHAIATGMETVLETVPTPLVGVETTQDKT